MSRRIRWCSWSYQPVEACVEHGDGHPHRDEISDLGTDDEPQTSGALVLVWPGDYRRQEVWVASGANIGSWYCLGNEFRRPKVWDAPTPGIWDRSPRRVRPAGTVPVQPTWSVVLGRGPVSLLSVSHVDAYREGWRNGRRSLAEQIESLAEEDPGEGDSGANTVADD